MARNLPGLGHAQRLPQQLQVLHYGVLSRDYVGHQTRGEVELRRSRSIPSELTLLRYALFLSVLTLEKFLLAGVLSEARGTNSTRQGSSRALDLGATR